MKSMPNIDKTNLNEIELQPTSLDIWRTKYRLTSKDGTAIDSCVDDNGSYILMKFLFFDYSNNDFHYAIYVLYSFSHTSITWWVKFLFPYL